MFCVFLNTKVKTPPRPHQCILASNNLAQNAETSNNLIAITAASI